MNDVTVSTEHGAGIATTNHAASSYGMPVVVVEGTAYGPAEIGAVGLPTYGPEDVETAAMHSALQRAGYEVHA